MKEFLELCAELTASIQSSYESGINMEEAERLAGKFLYAQLQVAEQLQVCDLDRRMRKSGVKAVRAAIYLAEASKGEKKPTEAALAALVESNKLVQEEQEAADTTEVLYEKLDNYYNIFRESHIHFRGIGKARFS